MWIIISAFNTSMPAKTFFQDIVIKKRSVKTSYIPIPNKYLTASITE